MRIEVAARGLALLTALLAVAHAEAGTFYVSTQGNDSNPGTAAQPFRTITRAYSHATAGTTILVLPGTYTDYTSRWGIHLGANGTAASPIVLRSQTPGAAVIDGLYASDRNVGFYIDGSYNILDGFEIKNGPNGGITIWANHTQILNCNIHNNGNHPSTSTQGRDGIYSNEGTSGNVYTANYIHDNGRTGSNLDHGLYLCGHNETVNNNVVRANTACGLQVAGYTTVSNLKVYNNVFAYNGTDGIVLWQSLSGVYIKNNIFYGNGHWGIGSWDAHGSGVVVDHNLAFGNSLGSFNFRDGGSDYAYTLGTAIYTNPRFANGAYTGFDAHLATGSPAILAGLNLEATFTTDMAGAARQATGAWDLGAYRFGTPAQPVGTSQTIGIIYVSTQGNDSNPGTAVQPFRTITQAYSHATAGTTILVLPGTYTDYTSRWGIHLGANGTATSPIVLRSQTPGAAVIDGLNASDRNVCFYIDGSYNIIDGFEIKGGPNGGITIWANSNQILNCNIHNNGNAASASTQGRDGIYSNEGTSGNIYTANYIHDNGRTGSNLDHGLYLCGQNETVNNNLLRANAACGLQVAGYTTVSNLKVYNNVMAYNGTDGIVLWQSLSGVDVKNNIFYGNGHWGIGSWDAHGSGVVVDHNLAFGNSLGSFNFRDGGSDYAYTLGTAIYTDPGFANGAYTGFDAHLTTGSPAILAGLNLEVTFTTDMTGAARQASGAWDLGAYKYASSVTGGSAVVTVVATAPTAIIGTTNFGAFTFTRTGDTSAPLTVNYTLGGSAVTWDDYRRPETGDMPVSITFPAGAASYRMNIWAVGNETGANPEKITLALSTGASYQLVSPSAATITILSQQQVAITKAPAGMTLTWDSVVGQVYHVATKTDLTAPWNDLSGGITATGASTSWTDTSAAISAQRLYAVYTPGS